MSERTERDELAGFCRRLWERSLTSGSSGNVSLRLEDGDLLATPSGRSLANLAPNELVRVAPDGTPRDPAQRVTSELPLHLAAYRVRPDICCVVHTHPTFSVVWSKTGRLFARDTVGAMESLRACAWTPYRKNGTQELAELCGCEFARGIDLVVMERHGLTAISHDLEDAFVQTELAEEAAKIAYYSAYLPRAAEPSAEPENPERS
ncbi:MAG: class II aldolase/adducin family protein [bacterium]|nr:class II aldolase/adducin family protein [bacterium]